MNMLNFSIASAAIVLTSSFAAAHYDADLKIVNGTIVADGYSHETGTIAATDLRLFGYDFGEEPLDPYNISDPGFNASAGSGLSGQVSMQIAGSLMYWDGQGSVSFGAAPNSEAIRVTKSNTASLKLWADITSSGVTYFSNSGAISALPLASTTSGALHTHLTSSLVGGDGSLGMSLDNGNPTSGIYAFQVIFTNGAATSEPIWYVFNNGLTEQQHDDAMAFLEAAPVPEPAALATLGIGALAILTRRKH